MPCLLLLRAGRGPPALATQFKPLPVHSWPCPLLSGPTEQEPQLPPEPGLCFSPASTPCPFTEALLWQLSASPVLAFLVCPSHQNLNQPEFLHLKGKKTRTKASASPSSQVSKITYIYMPMYAYTYIHTQSIRVCMCIHI